MTEQNKKINLKQKLVEIRKHIGVMRKTLKGNNNAFYVDPGVLLLKGVDKMNELGVLLTSNVLDSTISKVPNPTKAKPEAQDFCVSLKMEMVFHDTESGETLGIPWFAVGTHATDPSMAGGGALTYSERYFIMKQFNVPTTKDDPEFFKEQVNGPELVNKEQLDAINVQVGLKVTDYPQFLKYIGVGRIEDLHAKRFGEIMGLLDGIKAKP